MHFAPQVSARPIPRVSSFRAPARAMAALTSIAVAVLAGIDPTAIAAEDSAPTTAPARRTGVVSLDGHALHDDQGPFLGLGATYFRAMERARNDRERFRSDLAFLAAQGINYIRILSMVGWYEAWEGLEIAPVDFVSRDGKQVAAWPDYWQQLQDTIDIAYDDYGIRIQITIFADAQLMPEKADRIRHMETLLQTLEGREHKVILLEVANESWQNGFPDAQGIADVREFGDYLAARTDILIALSDTPANDNAGLEEMYQGSAADIATEHFERDSDDVEGTWLHVRAPWRVRSADGVPPVSDNEPMGPGSSVRSENDPIKLVCAAAFAYIAQLPMYVFHSEAGVIGTTRFEDQPGIRHMRNLTSILPADLPNWTPNDGIEPAAPFTITADGLPDTYWPDARNAATGALRNIGAIRGDEFVALPMGILPGGVTLEARRDLFVEAYDPLTGLVAQSKILRKGEPFTLPQGPGAYILKGRFTAPQEALAKNMSADRQN